MLSFTLDFLVGYPLSPLLRTLFAVRASANDSLSPLHLSRPRGGRLSLEAWGEGGHFSLEESLWEEAFSLSGSSHWRIYL